MKQAFYRALLRLFPDEHRELFEAEMLNVLDAAECEQDTQSFGLHAAFILRETAGLLTALVAEHLARLARGERYARMPVDTPDIPVPDDEAARLRQEIPALIEVMQRAIAQHDFTRARQFSTQERMARARLCVLTGS